MYVEKASYPVHHRQQNQYQLEHPQPRPGFGAEIHIVNDLFKPEKAKNFEKFNALIINTFAHQVKRHNRRNVHPKIKFNVVISNLFGVSNFISKLRVQKGFSEGKQDVNAEDDLGQKMNSRICGFEFSCDHFDPERVAKRDHKAVV